MMVTGGAVRFLVCGDPWRIYETFAGHRSKIRPLMNRKMDTMG